MPDEPQSQGASVEEERGDAQNDARGEAQNDERGDAQNDDDRREQRRAPIELKVEYKRLNTFFFDYTRNISKGGTFIHTERPLPIGTMFVFRLSLPTLDQPLELRGEVRWVVRAGQPLEAKASSGPVPAPVLAQEPGMGIRFVYDGPEPRLRFERVVEGLMVNSLGPHIYEKLIKTEPER